MASIQIGTETERPGAWLFDVALTPEGEPTRQITARLAWPDYDHWTSGSVSPARLIEHITRFLVEHTPPDEIPDAFDAAAVRRKHPALTEYLSNHLDD